MGEGTEAFGSNLQTLDLSSNAIGSIDSAGNSALGEGLRYVSLLKTLDYRVIKLVIKIPKEQWPWEKG